MHFNLNPRTCEILGVAKLLIENMNILSKVEFSALSLNANQVDIYIHKCAYFVRIILSRTSAIFNNI